MPPLRCPVCRDVYWSQRALAPHMRAHDGAPLLPVAHGTVAGYRAECNRGLPTCADCRAAWRRYTYQRRGTSPPHVKEPSPPLLTELQE